MTESEYENIPEELKYRIVLWFLRRAEKKIQEPYWHISNRKLAVMYHDLMESIDPTVTTEDV